MSIRSAADIAAILAANGLAPRTLLTVSAQRGSRVCLDAWSLRLPGVSLELELEDLHSIARGGELDCYCDDDVIDGAPIIVSCPFFAAQYYRVRRA